MISKKEIESIPLKGNINFREKKIEKDFRLKLDYLQFL